MLSYKLCLQLKKAGFPQEAKIKNRPFYLNGKVLETNSGIVQYKNKDGYEIISIPTLSELIKACGEKFGELIKEDKRWIAWTKDYASFETCIKEPYYKSPEEAVVKLWLKLNNDKVEKDK